MSLGETFNMDIFCDCVYNSDERISQIGNLALFLEKKGLFYESGWNTCKSITASAYDFNATTA